VYGEKIDIYSSNVDPLQKEFLEVGVQYVKGFMTFLTSWPVYRIYPNKTYREYVKTIERMHSIG
jgi:hypothetical protein